MAGNGMRRAGTSIGGLLVGAIGSAALAGILTMHVRAGLADHTGAWQIDSVIELAVTAVGALVAAWLAAGALLATVCVVVRAAGASWRAGERLVHRCAPQIVRKALVLAVGAGIGLGVATGASAAVAAPSASVATVEAAAPDDLGWAPTTQTAAQTTTPTTAPTTLTTPAGPTPSAPLRPAAAPPPSPQTTEVTGPAGGATTVETAAATHGTAAQQSSAATVVVEAGDSLWAIAARHLPPNATNAQVAAAWPRWYEANSSVIGPDPDTVRPGQVLTVPATAGEPTP